MELLEDKLNSYSPEQLAAYQEIIATNNTTNAEFGWSYEFQRQILSMLLWDRLFLAQSLDLIKYYYFTNKAHKEISKVLFEHFRKYRAIPSKAIIVEQLKDKFKNDETKLFYLTELQDVYDSYEPGIDSREYNQHQIVNFARKQALQEAMEKSLNALKTRPQDDETWDKIYDWFKATNIDLTFELGLDYFTDLKDRYARMHLSLENAEVFTTGFTFLDDCLTSGGMRRGEVYSFMGPPGVGKSLCLVKTAAENIKRDKRVLYISLEMSQDDIATRFDAQLADTNIRTLIQNEQLVFNSLQEYVQGKHDQRQLIIKQFPSGSADVNTIRAYLMQLQMLGWAPDLLVVDYIGEMKDKTGVPLYESREILVKELRGLAVEYDFCLVTAMQPNRAAREAMKEGGVIEDSNLGDSYGQLRPLDGLFTINQEDREKATNVARIYIAKLRSGNSRRTYHVYIDPVTLKFCEISLDKYKKLLSTYQDKIANEVVLNDIVAKPSTNVRFAGETREPDVYGKPATNLIPDELGNF